MNKVCSRCQVLKPLHEYHNDRSRPDGKQRTCKVCLTAYNKARDAANPEKAKARILGWHRKNRTKETARMRRWRSENPERSRAHLANYKARRYSAGKLPYRCIPAMLQAQNGQCAICSIDLIESGYHVDHIIPLFRGGKNSADNVQLLCAPCNLSKGYKLPNEKTTKRVRA